MAAEEKYDPTAGNVRPKLRGPEDIRFIPLFASALDDDPRNETAQAIRAMIQEEDPVNRAQHLKVSGNQAYQIGPERWNDAVIYYTQALECECGDDSVDAIIYANRAQVNLKLKKYYACIADCERSIERKVDHIKAYFRAAQACLLLKKYEQGVDFTTQGIDIAPGHEQLNKLHQTLVIKTAQYQEQKREDNEIVQLKEQSDLLEKQLLQQIFEDRGITFTEDKFSTSTYGFEKNVWVHDTEEVLVFPVMFIYAQYNQTDFIQQFTETTKFMDQFKVIFKDFAPWDERGEYKPKKLDVYFTNKHNNLVKMNAKKTLAQIINRKDYDIPHIPVFYILPKKSNFTQEFKQTYQDY